MRVLSFDLCFNFKTNLNYSTSSSQNRPKVNFLYCKDTIDMKQLSVIDPGNNDGAYFEIQCYRGNQYI